MLQVRRASSPRIVLDEKLSKDIVRRIIITLFFLVAAVAAYIYVVSPKADTASADSFGCTVKETAATCKGSWVDVETIPNPGAITELVVTQMNGPQRSLENFTSLKIVAIENTALNIAMLPKSVTKVGVIGHAALVPDPARTLEHFYLVGEDDTVERIMNQPARNITAMLATDQIDLNPLNTLTSDNLVIKVSHATRPKLTLDGYEEELSNFREHKVIKDPFTNAISSELIINRTARR